MTEQNKRKIKFVTSSRDGFVKVWHAHNLQWYKTIKVTDNIWVTCTHYMTFTKRLAAASANRMISFYDIEGTNYNVPVSRIEGLVGIPLCMEYYPWRKNNDGKYETLLVGDDLGICHMWNFTQADWHTCQYKMGTKDANHCHKAKILDAFDTQVA
jgi:WD40 repeat protein